MTVKVDILKVEIYTKYCLDSFIKALEFAKTHAHCTDISTLNLFLSILESIAEPEKVKMCREKHKLKTLQFYMDKSDDNIIDLVTSGLKYKIIKK